MPPRSTHRAYALLVLLAIAALFSGCEKRVVGIENRWVGQRPEIVRVNHIPNTNQPGFFDGIGEFLFGWTRGLFGDPNPQPTTENRTPTTYAPYNPDANTDRKQE